MFPLGSNIGTISPTKHGSSGQLPAFHTGIFDYYPKTRHGTRVISQAERPYLDKDSKLFSEVEFEGYKVI